VSFLNIFPKKKIKKKGRGKTEIMPNKKFHLETQILKQKPNKIKMLSTIGKFLFVLALCL